MAEMEPGEEGRIFTWSEVSATHRTRNGIYQKNGELMSLLTDFGKLTPCYPDFEGDSPDTIFYTGSGRRGDQKRDVRNSALLAAVHSGKSVPLFCKLGVNRWKFLGFWRVVDSEYVFEGKRERMVWRFVLRKVD
ncbi:MAG TPA: hypothetical protein VMM38_01975 [Aridibacter sp.]|nr:hypothetical protein [Aridibacter sp.]